MPAQLTRARFDPETARSKYYHHGGYTITQRFREPISRVGRMNGQADRPGPMTWWEVKESFRRTRGDGVLETFSTLRSARAYCDRLTTEAALQRPTPEDSDCVAVGQQK